ncbi:MULTISPECIES: LuxR family transcriptional regulator [unclassified Microbacterium]|uniref:helix-turn-helix transcriptional regulator n=1 Tax=unclassified Microbacterium TaxID=2609290 RepID=UPI00214AC5E2|nr:MULTISPECIES: LuxR family transcriptional regulator [unclassified Microbacterium]MCR2810608.1 LuxR family transcriptional regulator [Microbacterium sp. zg.B185]WIM18145.1 LuxR family transcriptional regulator [Microbacterium sp. zg-B185]
MIGRRAELEAIDRLLSRARAGQSGALVVHGDAGIGKTALLEHARRAADASGFRVETSVGVESETQFAFAGLHQLCAPLLDRASALPDPQQTALSVAFGQEGGETPDRFLVGLATLNLLAEVAEEGPLLCLIDDAQWLDEASAQVLAFVARRLAAERIALVFAVRDRARDQPGPELTALAGLPVLRLHGLEEADARALLASALPMPLDDRVFERVVAESFGNPMALLELPLSASPAQLTGGFELPGVLDVPRRVEESFRRRSGSLPADTRLLLVVAAAEPTGDVALLWRAAAQLGIDDGAAAAAEDAGLLEIADKVRFRHPLARSAVYRDATPPEQRRAHGALAAATDPATDPDRRAWHRAQAVQGTDEDAAAELERSAGRARARGGLGASAAFMAYAARLSPEPAARAGRALEAAFATHEAGATEAAGELLTRAAAGPLDALQQARLELLHARIGFHRARGGEGLRMLLGAAGSLAPLDPALSRETYLDALDAAIVTGGVGSGPSVRDVAEAARAAPAPPGPPRPADLLLDGLVTTFTEGYTAGAPRLRQALAAFCQDESDRDAVGDADLRRWGWLASRTAMAVFDDELVLALTARHVRLAREAGALATLPAALLVQSVMLVLSGEFAQAAEQTEIGSATTAVPLLHAQLILAAWRGDPVETDQVHAIIEQEAAARGPGTEVFLAEYAMAVQHNGLGDYPAAQAAAARAFESDELRHSNLAHSELIEAACRAGRPESAAQALEELTSRAVACATPWALGLAARSRALTSTAPEAEEHFREAIEQLARSKMATQLARTHLVYGEWLRREGRRHDAREQLRTAHDLLSDMGAEAFAARAARELQATGGHPRTRAAQPTDALTAHELHIARLVANGATSREVGTQLFLSPRTIEAHLRNIFRKLGISSRRQLRDLPLPGLVNR